MLIFSRNFDGVINLDVRGTNGALDFPVTEQERPQIASSPVNQHVPNRPSGGRHGTEANANPATAIIEKNSTELGI